ncbi:MAG: glycosyltransferase family 2 protein [Candidatus Micrarchaeota archaeon]|nr:glycosyltransferase family 2 protein [Candidatus Micrarchaeota archaeon]
MEAFVLNYNGGEKILKCLSRLSSEIGEITLVDNASTDNSVELVRKNFPKVKIASAGENIVARAFNEPIMNSASDWVLIMLGDMMATKGFLGKLARHAGPGVFAVSPKIVRMGGGTDWAATELSFRLGQPSISWNTQAEISAPRREAFPPITGLFNARLFRELGGFDALYSPTYYDDVDLGYRAWKRGWKCVYEPASVVEHDHDAAIGKAFSNVKTRAYRNKHLFVWKNADRLTLAQYALSLPFYLAAGTLLRGPPCLLGFLEAFGRLDEARARRAEDEMRRLLSDREIREAVAGQRGQ